MTNDGTVKHWIQTCPAQEVSSENQKESDKVCFCSGKDGWCLEETLVSIFGSKEENSTDTCFTNREINFTLSCQLSVSQKAIPEQGNQLKENT